MPTDVVMPQMGESIAEGTITTWLVKVGDTVERDQPLFEISTDKVDAEIPSPAAGVILEIKAAEGATVPIDEVVAVIGEAGEKPAEAAAEKAPKQEAAKQEAAKQEAPKQEAAGQKEAPKQEAAPQETPKQPPAPAEAVSEEPAAAETEEKPAVGGQDGGAYAPRPGAAAAASPAPAPRRPRPPAGDLAMALATDEGQDGRLETLEERVKKYSSPVVRKMAEAEGIDISRIEGSGVHGRVTKQDLEDFIASGGKSAAAPAPAAAQPEASAAPRQPAPAAPPASGKVDTGFSVPAYGPNEEVEIEPMSRIRQITAAHMRYSKDTSAHVTTVFHIDMSGVHAARNAAKDGFFKANQTKLSYMPFIFKAVASALKRHKKLNAAIDGTNVVFKKAVNLGMAVAIDRGLIVPVLKNADTLSLVGLAKTANDLADRARNKKLKPDEAQGGTFTITNPGVFGSLFGTPIINQPQVAILGLGTIEKRPVVVQDQYGNDSIAIKVMSYFAITYDHRLVDGADADHFMNDVKETLEEESWQELGGYR